MKVTYKGEPYVVIWSGTGKDGTPRYLLGSSYYSQRTFYVDASECQMVRSSNTAAGAAKE